MKTSIRIQKAASATTVATVVYSSPKALCRASLRSAMMHLPFSQPMRQSGCGGDGRRYRRRLFLVTAYVRDQEEDKGQRRHAEDEQGDDQSSPILLADRRILFRGFFVQKCHDAQFLSQRGTASI